MQVHGGIAQLREIRSSVYEDVNQIQHEYLLLRGLEWLLVTGWPKRTARLVPSGRIEPGR